MNRHYLLVADGANHRCEANIAMRLSAFLTLLFDVEHIRPRASGGGDSLGNFALACESCNLYKSDRITVVDENRQRRPAVRPS